MSLTTKHYIGIGIVLLLVIAKVFLFNGQKVIYANELKTTPTPQPTTTPTDSGANSIVSLVNIMMPLMVFVVMLQVIFGMNRRGRGLF